MQASRRNCLYALVTLACICLLAPRAHAETLTITSTPPGATVDMNGVIVGTTHYTVKYPGGYFHRTHSVFGTRLEDSIVVRIYKDGYTAREMKITDGPFEWVSLTGRDHGKYWLIKSSEVTAKLELISAVYRRARSPSRRPASIASSRRELPVEEVVETAAPPWLKLKVRKHEGADSS